MNFEKRKQLLETLGWFVSTLKEGNAECFIDIELPFTAQDWCRLCMKDTSQPKCLMIPAYENGVAMYERSEYVGWGGEFLQKAQTIILNWFLEGGHIKSHELVELGLLLRDHGGEYWEEDTNPFKEQPDHMIERFFEHGLAEELSAWGKLSLLYHLVKDFSPSK